MYVCICLVHTEYSVHRPMNAAPSPWRAASFLANGTRSDSQPCASQLQNTIEFLSTCAKPQPCHMLPIPIKCNLHHTRRTRQTRQTRHALYSRLQALARQAPIMSLQPLVPREQPQRLCRRYPNLNQQSAAHPTLLNATSHACTDGRKTHLGEGMQEHALDLCDRLRPRRWNTA